MASISKRTNKNGDVISYQIRVSRGYDKSGKKMKTLQATFKPEKWMNEEQSMQAAKKFAEQFELQCKMNSNTGRKANEQYLFLGEKEEVRLLTSKVSTIEVPTQEDLDRLDRARRYLLEIPCDTGDIIPKKRSKVSVRCLDFNEMHDILVGIINAYTILENCKIRYDAVKNKDGDMVE